MPPTRKTGADHTVHRLDHVGRVRRFANGRRQVEHRDDVRPFRRPLFDDRRILRAPAFAKRLQFLFGFQHGRRLVDVPQITNDLAAVGIGDVLQRGPHQMHDAQLDAGLGERRLDRFRETREAVNTRDEDVGHAAVLQIGQARQPGLRHRGLP